MGAVSSSLPSADAEVAAASADVRRRQTPAKRALRAALLVLVGVFVVRALWQMGKGWDPRQVELHWGPLLLGTLVFVGASFVQSLGWHVLLERMTGRSVPLLPLFDIYMAGQLARYTPGKIALPLVRIAGAPRLGASARLVASSVGLEVISWLASGALVGVAALSLAGRHAALVLQRLGGLALPGALLALVGVLLMVAVDRRRFPKFLLRLIHAEGQGPLAPVKMVGFHALSWLGAIIHGVLMTLAVGATFGASLESAGAFVLAPIAGFLVLVAPGGLGVREVILTWVLVPAVGDSRALAAVLVSRLTSVVADLVAWLIARLLAQKSQSATLGASQ